MVAALALCLLAGCTSTRQWWRNGCKVGPNYDRPPAATADRWRDADDPHVRSEAGDYRGWWMVFGDPVLNRLVDTACRQNLPLKMAELRILEARAQRAVAAGGLFPQKQQMTGSYLHSKFSDNSYPFGSFPGNREYDNWSIGFDAAWELDIWGAIRRGVEAADANVEAQIENYGAVLVMLQAETAAAYIQMRTLEEQLALTRKNVEIQERSLEIVRKRFEQGIVSELDVRQAAAQLAVTKSMAPKLEEAHRQVQNALCLLVGLPPGGLQAELAQPGPIPAPPADVVVGIPADLLRRRPDVRRAERQAAAQCARIGVAVSEFYPHLAITGAISLDAEQFSDVLQGKSLAGRIGPGFQWNILNYGRIRNRVRAEDARFQQAVIGYQNAVLAANKEAEDAIVAFLREQQRAESLQEAVREVTRALEIGLRLYQEGVLDYQRVLDSLRAVVLQEDALAQSRGKMATNLVAVYKALGGGWPTECSPQAPRFAPAGALPARETRPETPVPFPAESPPPEAIPEAPAPKRLTPLPPLPRPAPSMNGSPNA